MRNLLTRISAVPSSSNSRIEIPLSLATAPGKSSVQGVAVNEEIVERTPHPALSIRARLTAFVFAADPKSQKNGSRGDRASAPTNVDARTKLKGAERELKNTVVFAAGGFLAKKTAQTTGPVAPVEITHSAPGAHPR